VAGVVFEAPALAEVFRLTKGYPYFLQEWGYQAWNLAAASPITLSIVKAATTTVVHLGSFEIGKLRVQTG
jgi:hypothetical protein